MKSFLLLRVTGFEATNHTEASPPPSSPLPLSGHFLCLGAAGSRPGSNPHVPVRHHLPPDLPPQLLHHLLGLHGVGHRHLPPGALRLLPAAPRQRRPCLHTKLRFSIKITQVLCLSEAAKRFGRAVKIIHGAQSWRFCFKKKKNRIGKKLFQF